MTKYGKAQLTMTIPLYCLAQFQFSTSQIELSLALNLVITDPPPPRGGKSVATWQPSCQKVFEESGSGRKFLDLSSALSHKQAIR